MLGILTLKTKLYFIDIISESMSTLSQCQRGSKDNNVMLPSRHPPIPCLKKMKIPSLFHGTQNVYNVKEENFTQIIRRAAKYEQALPLAENVLLAPQKSSDTSTGTSLLLQNPMSTMHQKSALAVSKNLQQVLECWDQIPEKMQMAKSLIHVDAPRTVEAIVTNRPKIVRTFSFYPHRL